MSVESAMNVREAHDGDGERWDAYAAGARAPFWHEWLWREVYRARGLRPCYLVAEGAGGLTGILPAVVRPMWLNNSMHSTLGGGCYGGPVADDDETREALMEELERCARRSGAPYVEVTLCPYGDASGAGEILQRRGYRAREGRERAPITFELGLGDFDAIWKERLNTKARNQTRKATKSGVVILREAWEKLPLYYEILVETYRRLGSPPPRRDEFLDEWGRLRPKARVHLAAHGDRVVAGTLSFVSTDTWFLVGNVSRDEARKHCPNNLLYTETLRDACEAGLARYDFGSTAPGSSHAHWKGQYGGTPRPIESYVKVLSPWRYTFRRISTRPRVMVRRLVWGKIVSASAAQRLSPQARRFLEWF